MYNEESYSRLESRPEEKAAPSPRAVSQAPQGLLQREQEQACLEQIPDANGWADRFCVSDSLFLVFFELSVPDCLP